MSPLLVVVGLLISAPPVVAPSVDPAAQLEKLKKLEGNWKAGEKDAAKFLSLRVIANGTAVLEMVTGADRTRVASASVYSVEGGRLVAAHYGAGGTSKLEGRPQELFFEGKGSAITSVSFKARGDDALTHETVGTAGKVTLQLVREYVDTLK